MSNLSLQTLRAPGGAWRLAWMPAGETSPAALLAGIYDGRLASICPETGAVRWTVPLGGFPFAVAVGGPGNGQVGVATADGRAAVFDREGRPLWHFDTGLPLYNVVSARIRPGASGEWVIGGVDRCVRVLDADGGILAEHRVERLAHRIVAADFDGDGVDEILVMDYRETAEMLKWDGGKLERVWRRDLQAPESMRNWENPRCLFHVHGIVAGDLDGDGRAEFVVGDDFHNKQPVMLCGPEGGSRWISQPLAFGEPGWERSYDFYAGVWPVLTGEDRNSPLPAIMTVAGATVRGFTADGGETGRVVARVGFTDVLVADGAVWLGSSPDGDDTIYRVAFTESWAETIESIERCHHLATVGGNIERIAAGGERGVAETADPPRKWDVELGLWGNRKARGAGRPVPRELDQSGCFRWISPRTAIEPGPLCKADGEPWNARRYETDSIRGTQTPDEIVAAVAERERDGIPTLWRIGHSCMPFVTLETAERMLQAGPECLAGFESAEDEVPEEEYWKEFIAPLADLCRRYGGKKLSIKHKNVWWMSMPANRMVYDALFGDGRGEVVVLTTEDSNSRTPEINLMARVGLRQSGVAGTFQVSVHGDLFCYNRFHQWEFPKSGHPYLRLLVAQTMLGGGRFRFSGPVGYADADGEWAWTRFGAESAKVFLGLLRDGLIAPPDPQDNVGLCRVGFIIHEPSDTWKEDGHNGHQPHRWPGEEALAGAVIPHNGVTWGNSPTPSHAIAAVALRKRRQFGWFVPATPYGLPVMVPEHAPIEAVPMVRSWWHTDGVALWREDGPRLRGAEAADALRADLEAHAGLLPFRASGDDGFFHSVRIDESRYRLVAVDPGWLDPRDRQVEILTQVPGEFEFRDLISGDRMTAGGGRLALTVPAGAFRLLEARRVS